MNHTKEDMPSITPVAEEIAVLGITSIDTLGGPLAGEEMGGFAALGLAQD